MSSPASRGKASKPSKGSTDDEACDEIGPEALPAPGAPVDEQLSHSLDFLRHPQPRHNPTNAQALQMAANDDDDRPSSKYGALASEDAKAAAREINAEIGGVIDAHFHMWTLMDSPRPFSAYLTADLRKFGLPYPPRRPGQAPPDDKIRARLQDYSRQYGTAEFNVRDYSSRDYLEDAVRCGVKLLGSTYMQCGWEGPDEGETAWAEKVRGNTGGIVATSIVGTVDMLGEPEAVEKTLRAHMAASPHFRGIRDMHLARGRREPERLADPRCLRNIATLERLGLVLDITAYQWSFPAIFEVVNKFPKMTFILDHMGPPVSIFDKQSEWDTWKTGLLAIAACPNVYVKLSCLMPVIGSRFHLDPTLPSGSAIAASKFGTMMRIALAAFGPRRCMWASNFPSDRGSAGWGELMAACWQVLKEEGVDAEGRRRVMRGTAEQVYRIAVPWDAAKL
ncbi:hypothetical protein DFJ74DRAFT_774308 [Hyaloraphidium curvatum]|nr:hypothetical protein DFJ74DRAFT_774308 [Hyaloraphidium curvatum]